MKRKIIIGLFAGAMAMIGSCKMDSSDDPGNAPEEYTSRVYPVKIQEVKKETITRSVQYTANLEPFEEIYFAPASPARIRKIHAEVGSRIRKGQLLIEMDPTRLQQAMIQLENARSNYRRIDTLYQLGSIPEQQYEQAKAQYEVAASNVESLKENTTLVSPVNGMVTGKYFEDGEMYSGAPNTQAGKAAILTLMQINPMKAVIAVSESYFPDFAAGMPVQVTTDIYPAKTFTGQVYRIHPTIDKATRTFRVETKISNPDEELRPGMFARVNLETGAVETIVVPAISIIKQEGTNNRFVFINENGRAKRIQVQFGKRFDDKVELMTNGIKAGDELIVAGQAKLMDGVEIEIEE